MSSTRKSNRRPSAVDVAAKAARKARRDEQIAIGGRPAQRAWGAKNGKALASKRACRKWAA